MKTLSVKHTKLPIKRGLSPERTRIGLPLPPLPFLSCHTKSRESDMLRVNQLQHPLLRYVNLLHYRMAPCPSIITVSLLTSSKPQMYTVLSRVSLISILNM